MNNNDGSGKSVQELKLELDLAQAAFHQAAASEKFVQACQRLEQAFSNLNSTAEAAREADNKLLQAQNLPVDSARRIAQGIPNLGDWHQALFPKERAKPADPQFSKLQDALDTAVLNERHARSELAAALHDFVEEKEKVLGFAISFVKARHAYESATGAPVAEDLGSFPQLALQELVQLPVVADAGLAMLIIPD